MTDRPVIFSAPMVRALLTGRKTQTRRLAVTTRDVIVTADEMASLEKRGWQAIDGANDSTTIARPSPWQKVIIGDRLWVRESCRTHEPVRGNCDWVVRYQADPDYLRLPEGFGTWDCKVRPAIHMPRCASRLTLVVTDVRRHPLQDITEADAIAEGAARLAHDGEGTFYQSDTGSHRCGFAGLWDHLHGARAWNANPEVVALTFTVHRSNIDAMPAHASIK